jgi:hypothetical protein
MDEPMRDSRQRVIAPSKGKPRPREVNDFQAIEFGRRAVPCRPDWADACRKLAATDDDALVLPELANSADEKLDW